MPLCRLHSTTADETRLALRRTINVHGCKILLAGCFAAGTKLLTREGWRAVETLREGDELASRAEHDPYGAVSYKPIEEVFIRTVRMLHLHLADGQTIRTTPEHPFWVRGEGWLPADLLRAGDALATLGGEWMTVAEAYDTGEYETVYNCRVAEWHTYFVGDDAYVTAVWAHNAYRMLFIKPDDNAGGPPSNLFNPFVTEAGPRADQAIPPSDIAAEVAAAKPIVLRIINALRSSMKHGRETNDTTGVALVRINGRTELWVAQSGDDKSSITRSRRLALYDVLTKDSVVRQFLAARAIVVELVPTRPLCEQTVKQVINIDPLGTKDNHLNDAERHIYRQLGTTGRLLAIGSTIKMCETCQAATEAAGLQYAHSRAHGEW
jgi:hypothetical protein